MPCFVTAHNKLQCLGNVLSRASGLRRETGKGDHIPHLALQGQLGPLKPQKDKQGVELLWRGGMKQKKIVREGPPKKVTFE